MGNSTSSSGRSHQDETVDYGYLTPRGVYTGPRDWNHAVVSQLICQRKLAPFYRPLEDYDESWDDDQILAARKRLPDAEGETVTRTETTTITNSTKPNNKRTGALKEPSKPEAAVYRGAVECPICFLYYPPNINHSRCCDQAICTECFAQMKRNEPTATHLVSEPAACPYCVQENFGVVYVPPPWRAGLGSEGTPTDPLKGLQLTENSVPYPTHKRRQKSFSADSPEVVTTDQIRPDWEAKLAAVRAAVARRANRRIVMRQVGDRLIPVGVTSGRVHPLGQEESSSDSSENGGSRRRRRQHNPAFEQFFGMSGQDLEELMLMEAMRLSLLEHEEQQRKESEERKKVEAANAAAASVTENTSPAGPGPSTIAARSTLSTHDSAESSSGTSASPVSSHPSTGSSATSSAHEDRETQPQSHNLASTDATSSIISRNGSSWHPHRSSPPTSNTPSTASAIFNEAMTTLPDAAGSTGGEQSELNQPSGSETSTATIHASSGLGHDHLDSSPSPHLFEDPRLMPARTPKHVESHDSTR